MPPCSRVPIASLIPFRLFFKFTANSSSSRVFAFVQCGLVGRHQPRQHSQPRRNRPIGWSNEAVCRFHQQDSERRRTPCGSADLHQSAGRDLSHAGRPIQPFGRRRRPTTTHRNRRGRWIRQAEQTVQKRTDRYCRIAHSCVIRNQNPNQNE